LKTKQKFCLYLQIIVFLQQWHRVERRYGSFKRQIALPEGVDNSKITATSADGVLHVVIPKPPQPAKKTAKIQIK
jgi:HSP20 family protein